MPDTITDAQKLIALANRTPTLGKGEQEKLSFLSRTVTEQPEQVWDELNDLRREHANRARACVPKKDYARCISAVQFWRYCLPESRRAEFENGADYTAYLESLPNPGTTAFRDLQGPNNDELVPAANSWIIPLDRVLDISTVQLPTRLQLRSSETGPFLILELPYKMLIQFGCRVRQPTGLDAVYQRNVQWNANAVPEERIDGPILRGMVGGILWRQ